MDALKAARLKACRNCPYRVIRPGAGWDWPRCDYGLATNRDLSDAFLAGPDSNCPLGRWKTGDTDDTDAADTAKNQGEGQPKPAVHLDPDHAVAVPPLPPVAVHPPSSVSSVSHCLFASVAKCCARKLECRRAADVVRLVTAEECNASCSQCVERLRIGAVITAWNEGAEVRRTVESLMASVSPETELRVIIMDDASKDKSCDGLASAAGSHITRVFRHEEPQGIGISRNEGWQGAQYMGCNVVSFHDAHMRFPGPERSEGPTPSGVEGPRYGALEALALRALQDRCIISAGSQPFKRKEETDQKEGCRFWGCDLFYNVSAGLQPKWLRIAKPPDEEWMQSPCIMGAGYVLSAETAGELEDATGALWEDTPGRWGFSEQALSVKAFLLDIPIYFSRDHLIWHAFRGTNPLPKAGREMWKNVARATYVLFGPDLFDERFRAHSERQITAAGVKEALAGAQPAAAAWAHPPGEVFTHLCGKRSVIDFLHPDLAWRDQVFATCMRPIARVLIWRTGEHLTWVRGRLPHAEIVCFEWSKHRFINWQAWCKEHEVALHQTEPLKDFIERPLLLAGVGGPAPSAAEGFDFALIAGDMQAECRAVAERVLAKGGQILVAPSQQDGQVADEFVKQEREQLKAAADPKVQHGDTESTEKGKNPGEEQGQGQPIIAARPGSSVAVDPASSVAVLRDPRLPAGGQVRASVLKPVVTVCLLNYKRYENIGPILDCLAEQTASCQVWLWNNGEVPIELAMGDSPKVPISEHPAVSLVVNSSRNLGCFPRWPMLALSGTEFIATLDDDLMFADDRVLADAVAACRGECPDGIVGFFGWSEAPGRNYRQGHHHNGTTRGTRCELIKGRFMLMRRALLQKVPLEVPVLDLPAGREAGSLNGMSHREDDIYVSLCVGGGRKDAHCIPARLGKRWKNLPERGTSMAGTKGHYDARDHAYRAIHTWMARRSER